MGDKKTVVRFLMNPPLPPNPHYQVGYSPDWVAILNTMVNP